MAVQDGHHRERNLAGPLFMAASLIATAAGAVAAERAGVFNGMFGGDRTVASSAPRTAEPVRVQAPVEAEPYVVYRDNLPAEEGRAGAVQLDDNNCEFFRAQGVSETRLRRSGC